MEQAVFIADREGLKYVGPEYTRLYFGSEFCERRIPLLKDILEVIDFVKARKMRFTLVTPYVTNSGLKNLKAVLETALPAVPDCEIVVNDWGVLRMMRVNPGNCALVLGRLLTKQKRDPRISRLHRNLPGKAVRHFKESNVDTPVLRDFLSSCGISRVELDNLSGGVSREKTALPASLYVPFAYVTTTRFCLTSGCGKTEHIFRSIRECSQECRSLTFALRHKDMPEDILLKGNTQFCRNDRLPDNLEDLNIDRIVFEPEIPV